MCILICSCTLFWCVDRWVIVVVTCWLLLVGDCYCWVSVVGRIVVVINCCYYWVLFTLVKLFIIVVVVVLCTFVVHCFIIPFSIAYSSTSIIVIALLFHANCAAVSAFYYSIVLIRWFIFVLHTYLLDHLMMVLCVYCYFLLINMIVLLFQWLLCVCVLRREVVIGGGYCIDK